MLSVTLIDTKKYLKKSDIIIIMSQNTNKFNCELCNKSYKEASGLWRHNKRYHSNINNEKEDDLPEGKKHICYKCNKQLANRVSRWRHEKTCCVNNDLVILKNEVKDLHTKIDKISTKPNIVTNNNYTQNNIVISCAPGFEQIAHLTNEQKKFIMNKGLSSLMYLIETTNFDKSKPENHSYCVTALNDKHASMIDTKTNLVVKTDKMELFDKVLAGNLNKLEKLSGDTAFGTDERLTHANTINRMKDILFNNKRGIKKYYSDINLLSYNNKDLIQDTWNSLKRLDELVLSQQFPIGQTTELAKPSFFETVDSDSDVESDDEINTEKLNKLRKQFGFTCQNDTCGSNFVSSRTKKIIPDDYESAGSELSDDSDDSDTEEATLELNIKGRSYIVEGVNVYVKNKDGTKGQVYGTYLNGKVAKCKNKDITV